MGKVGYDRYEPLRITYGTLCCSLDIRGWATPPLSYVQCSVVLIRSTVSIVLKLMQNEVLVVQTPRQPARSINCFIPSGVQSSHLLCPPERPFGPNIHVFFVETMLDPRRGRGFSWLKNWIKLLKRQFCITSDKWIFSRASARFMVRCLHPQKFQASCNYHTLGIATVVKYTFMVFSHTSNNTWRANSLGSFHVLRRELGESPLVLECLLVFVHYEVVSV